MYKKEVDHAILAKYLAGEATPGEALAVAEWGELPGNKKQFAHLTAIWQLLPGTEIYNMPQIANEWAVLQNSIPEKTPGAKTIRMWHLMLAAACAGTIIIGTFIFYSVFNNHPGRVAQKTITLTSRTGHLKDTLPDGSTLVLNRNSTIQYPETFDNTSRRVLLNGEAYFNIVPEKTKPFIIIEDQVTIKVVGTSFNVSKTINPSSVIVQVQSGTVKMYTNKDEITVSTGHTGIYMKNTNEFYIENSINPNSMSYATGNFSFINLSLGEIAGYLQKAFDVNIVVNSSTLLQCRMSANFLGKSLAYIMEVISVTLHTRYTIKNNKINIYGEGCN